MEQMQNKLQARGINISGIAANRMEAFAAISLSPPDLILTKVDRKAGEILDTVRRIKIQFPQIHIIILADDDKYYSSAIDKGASQYLLTSTTEDALLKTMRDLSGPT